MPVLRDAAGRAVERFVLGDTIISSGPDITLFDQSAFVSNCPADVVIRAEVPVIFVQIRECQIGPRIGLPVWEYVVLAGGRYLASGVEFDTAKEAWEEVHTDFVRLSHLNQVRAQS